MKAEVTEKINPHCTVWARSRASLWGMSSNHHLDEPVRLTEEVAVRVRRAPGGKIETDRPLSLKTIRSATHISVRFYFRPNKFLDLDLIGVPSVSPTETINVGMMS
jgi:hypothetical protein